MVTKSELEQIKVRLYIPSTPKYTQTQLHLLLQKYADIKPEGQIDSHIRNFMVELLMRKLAAYTTYPWMGDEILEQAVKYYK